MRLGKRPKGQVASAARCWLVLVDAVVVLGWSCGTLSSEPTTSPTRSLPLSVPTRSLALSRATQAGLAFSNNGFDTVGAGTSDLRRSWVRVPCVDDVTWLAWFVRLPYSVGVLQWGVPSSGALWVSCNTQGVEWQPGTDRMFTDQRASCTATVKCTAGCALLQ